MRVVPFFSFIVLELKNHSYGTYFLFHCKTGKSKFKNNSLYSVPHFSYGLKYNIVYVNNTKVCCIIPDVYVWWLMGRGTPKSRWCGTFAKHYANGAVSGSSGGCVADGPVRVPVEEDGSPICCSHQQFRRTKSNPTQYH